MMTRTTITIPTDLYELLRLQAYQHRTSFSGIIQKKLLADVQKRTRASGLLRLAGKYRLQNKPFNRTKFYDAATQRDMALGH